jgi:hypothetical protein
MTDFTPDQIGTLAERIAVRVHGSTPDTAPAALLGYAASLKAATSACALATPDLCRSAPPVLFAALANLARNGLMPGAAGDKTATAYLYLQNRAVVGKPNPLGRVRMAAAAGVDVITLAVGKADTVKLGEDGDVIDLAIDPDRRPVAWADLRGVVVALTSHATGAVRRVWVSAGEIDVRKRRSSSGDKGPWTSDPVGMARSKAISIAVDRGDIPQAPIPVCGPVLASPAPRALPAPAEAAQPAPEATEAAPAGEPESAPADEADAQPEATVPAAEATAPEPTWGDVFRAVVAEVRKVHPSADAEDLRAAVKGALDALRAGAPDLTPGRAAEVHVHEAAAGAVARLRAM